MAKIFIINDTSITAGVASTSDVGTSALRWVNGWFSGTITVGTISASGAIIGGSASYSGTLTVGTLSATGAVISGTTITAGTASISGAVIGGSGLFSTLVTVGTLSASGNIISGTTVTAGTASISGAVIGASGAFTGLVTVGTLSASGAVIGGSGSITGGFVVVGSSTFGGILITDDRNVTLGTGTGTTFATGTNQKLAFYGTTPVVQQAGLTAQVGTVTFSEPTTPDYAIQSLTQATPYGFVTLDEGQSFIKVVANLQTRVSELETKIKAYGLLP